MRGWALASLIAFGWVAVSGRAQGDPPLPLGFADLHWSMSKADAERAFPALRQAKPIVAPGAQSGLDQSGYRVTGHVWGRCSFDGDVLFDAKGLSTITLAGPTADELCMTAALTAMRERYGPGTTKNNHGFSNVNWGGDPAIAVLIWRSDFGLDIGLYRDRVQRR